MRAADALDATSQAARGGLQGLDLEKESDTFNEEAAVTLDSIPEIKKDVKLFDIKCDAELQKDIKYQNKRNKTLCDNAKFWRHSKTRMCFLKH